MESEPEPVTHKEQMARFENDLIALIDRYNEEYDLSIPDLVGTLMVRVILLTVISSQILDDEEEEEETEE